MAGWWRKVDDGIEIRVRLTPRADRDAVEGAGTGTDGKSHLRVRVRAIPEDGKANAALVKLLAKAAGVAKADVRLISGGASRIKTFAIAGAADELATRLAGAAFALTPFAIAKMSV